jgi:hypothetical protein
MSRFDKIFLTVSNVVVAVLGILVIGVSLLGIYVTFFK